MRLVFCLYAEDAHLFGKRTAFHDYLAQYEAKDLRRALIDLFEVLDTPIEQRDRYLDDTLKAFPYVNGGLFSNDKRLEIPQFTEELKQMILAKASDDFDWSEISPTIFGAVFESTLNPETRRSGGMHYTSIENIHKVIDPLFLDNLKAEFEEIKGISQEKQQRQRLDAFQDKLASLTFFDPACGSGNFLTESYVSLRRLENQVIALRNKGQAVIGDFANPVKVDIHQFYGIEINDFAVSVATTALWIAEQQMLQETEKIASFQIKSLPLKAYHNIKEGNALRIDWSEVIAPEKLNYIMGNPPFVGARQMNEDQKQDMLSVFGPKWGNLGNMDYVCCWYKCATNLMHSNKNIHAAFVSTNSICQGEQVASLWEPLFNDGVIINFAHRTFRWDSEASLKAHVHCVIVGFSYVDMPDKILFDNDQHKKVKHINAYLTEAPNVFIAKRNTPLCDVSSMNYGSFALDDGNYTISLAEHDDLIQRDPSIEQFMRPFIGAQELLHAIKRWCIWLKDMPLSTYSKNSIIREKVERVQQWRAASNRKNTVMLADTPTLFAEIRQPQTMYLAVPTVCSEKRRYIPMAYLSPDIIASNQVYIVPEATLYHFGVLQSNVHMAWMRAVCGRLETRYRYSNSVVYNNFPWPTPTDEQRARIEQTAQAIIDAREKSQDVCLAELYDPVFMPPELRRAHQENDRAVMAAYGFSIKMTESECVAKLFEMYQALTH